ncbi:uncharacterized protein LOC108909440 isoform X2 [Anoplophora glabripennis]|uniref:uncharacterized protein LOC108909440 isoform X2 n=1 Tax=Anoplophora glabripennis TaxID=217634 RepID=UPI000875329D|nr:uncharacterized protein LOC108909440 isoform X2 [Anoplophora glabripennis]
MVSLSSVGVLVLFCIGICHGQRKGSRNIPVGADLKQAVNFDCPEEFGYYPHPSDCTQYYVCVFGGALLESCTGGLMYSHELQTCDWPRNVGCDGLEISAPPSSAAVSTTSARGRDRDRERERDRDEPRARYSPPPPPQPAAVVTSRGQSRQLHHTQQEIIKQQQQQLYADAEETLPPAEEIESDRQQRVYRGQPSTVGQVQRDRDGLRHSNAIPSYTGRGEKIGVISFGTQNQHYSDESSVAPAQPSIATATATARNLYNSSQYTSNHYDPYYALYDDDVELYRDVDYSQHNYNNAPRAQTTSYRGTPAPVVQSTSTREEPPKRGNSVYLNNYSQDIYQQSTGADYADDNRYDAQVDDQTSYRQSSRQPTSLRGDRNELNDVEEAITKRTTTSTTTRKTTTTTRTTTTTTTPRTIPPKKSTPPPPASSTPVTAKENQTQAQSIFNTIPEDPGHTLDVPAILPSDPIPSIVSGNRPDISTTVPATLRPKSLETHSDITLHDSSFRDDSVIKKPSPFSLPSQITTVKPAFHYITKAPKSTTLVSSTEHLHSTDDELGSFNKTNVINQHQTSTVRRSRNKIIVPTTYSPPKFFLKSILKKPVSHTTPIFIPTNASDAQRDNVLRRPEAQNRFYKTLRAVRKLINPVVLNHELSATTGTSYASAEQLASDVNEELVSNSQDYQNSNSLTTEPKALDSRVSSTTVRFSGIKPVTIKMKTTTTTTSTTSLKTTTTAKIPPSTYSTPVTTRKHFNDDYVSERLRSRIENEKASDYVEPDQSNFTAPVKKRFRTTVEIPPAHELLDSDDKQKPEPDQPPLYKPKPLPKPVSTATKTDVPQNTSVPTRASRVNAAIKTLIANGGTRRPNTKCNENQSPNSKCNNDPKQRTSSRGRGTAHYASNGAQITNNEVTVNTNRGTPAPRSRPTLKPSTSIVSKAQEFVDIYKYPPRRPDPIYPQPQPDKTAAKCRKDVCLLPDCSCGGKEIPGDLPVEQVPQIVLLTFDDSVNDLNKGLYMDLFEKGRTNPNGCPIAATFYVSHEWTDYSQVQNLYSDGHEIASHTVSHSFGEQFSQKKWTREVAGQREILSAYGGVHLEDVRGMRAPFLSVGGNKMFKMLYDSNFTYDSSMPIYENKPPSWPYTLDYKLFHDCMIPPCPTRSYPGVWEVPMVMWQDLNGGRCSMGDACSNPPDAEGVFKMLTKNFQRHYTTNRAPFGLFYHAAWFTQPHHKEGFINFIDSILAMKDVWLLTNWQAIQWVRDPTPVSRIGSFQPFQCEYSNRPKRCNNPKVCNLWHKSGVRYMRTCQPCPDIYPWTGNTGIRSSRIDNDIED